MQCILNSATNHIPSILIKIHLMDCIMDFFTDFSPSRQYLEGGILDFLS